MEPLIRGLCRRAPKPCILKAAPLFLKSTLAAYWASSVANQAREPALSTGKMEGLRVPERPREIEVALRAAYAKAIAPADWRQ
jgi:hypothetical protein